MTPTATAWASCGTPRRPGPRLSSPATGGSPTTWPRTWPRCRERTGLGPLGQTRAGAGRETIGEPSAARLFSSANPVKGWNIHPSYNEIAEGRVSGSRVSPRRGGPRIAELKNFLHKTSVLKNSFVQSPVPPLMSRSDRKMPKAVAPGLVVCVPRSPRHGSGVW